MLTVQRIEDASAFAGMAAEWNTLLRESAANRVFLTWEWLHTWWCHIGSRRRLSILAVREARDLVGIVPLVHGRSRLGDLLPLPRLDSLGGGSVGSDYLDVIAKRGCEDQVLDAVEAELNDRGAMIRMDQVDPRSALAARLAVRLGQSGWGVARYGAQTCPFVPLTGHTWESYQARLGAEHRYNFRRRLRNLENAGAFRFERVSGDGERREVLSTLVRLNHERWRKRGGSQAFHQPALVTFHDEVTRLAHARGWLRLYALRLDGRVAAALYGFLYDGTFSFYQSAFDPRDARHSVGLVAMGLAIKSAIEEGAVEYDMLHGDEAYKFLWCRETREVVRLSLYPPTALGRVADAASAVFRDARRTMRRVVPRRVREVLLAARRKDLDVTPAR
jgi:CelD/BcsL family acetyltransferase involved in cellulose biosynthesis